MRQAYWSLISVATSPDETLLEQSMDDMIAPRHFSHCTDILRQSLMCRPDLTVETLTPEGGVTGFGTEHECQDWDQLMSWMARWESYGQTQAYNRSEHDHHRHQ
ncbi:hypothetical protein BDQ94DRAFT_136575 [Aspergillus welwitschiae]|uniref:Uncharacterized protein n=2 Tax=Aspergillus TaxID=5052 RepID=A0A3F3QFS4_9EURO|nr:hypothetical protein BDQ94DRAFT_136575 [Aspergillus welwitschiae]RDH37526.1 hypothetical protein BDQ94DRAFT_136575 [Aspergillus welwitschiae]